MREGLGATLATARLEKGLSREVLARELNLSVLLLEAIETEDWERLPRGQERPVTRQVAARLGVDLEQHLAAWGAVPGQAETEAPDPRRDLLERGVMAALTVGSVGLMLWLVIPGRGIRDAAPGRAAREAPAVPAPAFRPPPDQPYPVLGEVLPEAARNEDGVLVSLRVLDACAARIEHGGGTETRVLQVSEPWRLRVKGAFAIHLDNAGVARLEVAGRPVPHGQSVGEAWEGRFDADGQWLRQAPPEPKVKPSAPDTDPPTEDDPRRGGQVE